MNTTSTIMEQCVSLCILVAEWTSIVVAADMPTRFVVVVPTISLQYITSVMYATFVVPPTMRARFTQVQWNNVYTSKCSFLFKNS